MYPTKTSFVSFTSRIKSVDGYHTYVTVEPASPSGLFHVYFQSSYDKAKNPTELRKTMEMFLTLDEMNSLSEALSLKALCDA